MGVDRGKAFTQRGLRRTFNDLARAARVESIITRSISGHLTERMQHHYSTINASEQREAIARVVSLFGGEDGGEGTLAGGELKKKTG